MTVVPVAPSVGRIVHYVSLGSAGGKYPSVCRAAVISEVGDGGAAGRVGLVALNPTGLFFHSLADGGCAYAAEPVGGTWHWPERVE